VSPRVVVGVLSMFLLCGIGLGALLEDSGQDVSERLALVDGTQLVLSQRMGCCGVFDPTECRCVEIRLPLEEFRPDDWERRGGFVLVPERQADQLVGVHDGLVQAYGVIFVYARPRR